jgi:hypothetical protein
MMRYRVGLAAIALTLLVVAAAVAQNFGAGRPEDRYFRIEFAVASGRHGSQVEGYVYNLYDAEATLVRLSVNPVDGAGRALEPRTAYVPLNVPPHGRSYFTAPVPAGTASAQVSVLNFEWTPRAGGGGGGGM